VCSIFLTTDVLFWQAWIMCWWIVSSRRILPEYNGFLFTYSHSWKSEEFISDKSRGCTSKPKCLRTSIAKNVSLFRRGQLTCENFPNIVGKGHRYYSWVRISWTWLLWRILLAIRQGLSFRNYGASDSVSNFSVNFRTNFIKHLQTHDIFSTMSHKYFL